MKIRNKTTHLSKIGFIYLCISFTAYAQNFQALDFSGPRTAITNHSETVTGYTFHNIFGNGSDASLDVVYNPTYSTTQFFSSGRVSDQSFLDFPSPRIGEVIIRNASKETAFGATSESSLGISLRSLTGSDFVNGTINARFDFFLHDSSGAGINNGTFRFITRDLDGGHESLYGRYIYMNPLLFTAEQIWQLRTRTFYRSMARRSVALITI